MSASLSFADPILGCRLPTGVSEHDVIILYAVPRLLVIRIVAPRFQALVCSIHGLDFDHGESDVSAFWLDSGTIIKRYKKKHERLLICIDGSCRICERNGVSDNSVGDVRDLPHRQNYVSVAFVDFCRKMNVMVTGTQSDLLGDVSAVGSLYTSLGTFIRCDYILVDADPSLAFHCTGSLWYCTAFDMDNIKIDHSPVRLAVTFVVTKSLPDVRRCIPLYDREAVLRAIGDKDPDMIAAVHGLVAYLQQMPVVPLAVDPTSCFSCFAVMSLTGQKNLSSSKTCSEAAVRL